MPVYIGGRLGPLERQVDDRARRRRVSQHVERRAEHRPLGGGVVRLPERSAERELDRRDPGAPPRPW